MLSTKLSSSLLMFNVQVSKQINAKLRIKKIQLPD